MPKPIPVNTDMGKAKKWSVAHLLLQYGIARPSSHRFRQIGRKVQDRTFGWRKPKREPQGTFDLQTAAGCADPRHASN